MSGDSGAVRNAGEAVMSADMMQYVGFGMVSAVRSAS